jgi:hypothetical protein
VLTVAPVPNVLGVAELAMRWGVSRQRADRITKQDGFPAGQELTRGTVYSAEDVEAWEAAERQAGRPLPGERPRGYAAGSRDA